MISQSSTLKSDAEDTECDPYPQVLVRFGAIPQVARFSVETDPRPELPRGSRVVVETDRGTEVGQVLSDVPDAQAAESHALGRVVRVATAEDLTSANETRRRCREEFTKWQQRIADWQLELELIELEWTLDQSKIVLYVLNDRGAETTRLALLAAAAGLGIIHVQPVTAEGVVIGSEGGGGCGSCGSH